MKLSDGFDARRLRPKGQSNWRFRFGAAIAAILATFGVLLAMAGLLTLLIQHSAYGLRLHAVGEYPQAAQAAGIAVTGRS